MAYGLPYYAVKCKLDPAVVQTLLSLGCHFDCTLRAKITMVQGLAAALTPADVSPSDIRYANPTKVWGHVNRVPWRANDDVHQRHQGTEVCCGQKQDLADPADP